MELRAPVLSAESVMGSPCATSASADVSSTNAHWRSLFFFNVYRLIVAILLMASVGIFADTVFGSRNTALFLYAGSLYALASAASLLTITSLLYASGGVGSGLGLLLLASLAAAGMISRGRLTMAYASIATLAVLLEQTFEIAFGGAGITSYIQAGLLSVGYFATGWLAHTLARYAVASELLAAQREGDLANLAQVNQLVIQDMQDGVLVVDERGAVRQINRRAIEILGPLPTAGRDLVLDQYAPALADRLRRWREDPDESTNPMRTVITHKLTGARFVPVSKSRRVGVVIFLEDLSRVQVQAQQMKLAAMGRLTANIAHEIRNPLSAINHATELLLEEPDIAETQGRLLQIVHENAQRLDRMVQDVLKLSRRDRAHRETFLLSEFLNTFVGQFGQIEKIGPEIISLKVEKDDSIVFDRSHLNQVMWNLVRNALRYCQRKQGSIQIRTRALSNTGAVELSVKDDGPGVPEAIRPHLFEPFFTTAANGTGLGLYIAREICEGNGASLEFVDEPIGAQFIVIFKGIKS
jgi:two-component system, NtrC family, sensor histidine kinase PilS